MHTPQPSPGSALRAWIEQICDAAGVTPTEIARRAGLSHSTLTRFLNSPEPRHQLRERSIAAIEEAFGIRRPAGLASSARHTLTAPAAPVFDPEPPGEKANAIAQMLNEAGKDALYMVADMALNLAGHLPQDLVLVDTNALPKPGDIVAVRPAGSPWPDTLASLRFYDPPFLTAQTDAPALRRPILIAPGEITLIGPVRLTARLSAPSA